MNTQEFGRCSICNNRFDKDTLLQSEQQNEYFCKKCFTSKYCSGKSGLPRHRPYSTIHQSEMNLSEKMFPNPERFCTEPNIQGGTNVPNPSLCSIGGPSGLSSGSTLSKRPLQCPHFQCNKCVGVFSLDSHFKYEHKEVPFVKIHLNNRTALEFVPGILRCYIKHCIILLDAFGDKKNLGSCRSMQSWKSRTVLHESEPLFLVLATRIAAHQLDGKGDPNSDSDADLQESSGSRITTDKILLWLASNITTNHSYTIALSSLKNDLRLKYYGPVLHLEETPLKLCLNGKGLILNYNQVERMTENQEKPLSLDVIVHSVE